MTWATAIHERLHSPSRRQCALSRARAGYLHPAAFAGYELTDRDAVQACTPAQTLTDAQRRANRLRADLEKRGVHVDVLRACRAELLQENYFHVVLEATKSISQKIRDKTGLTSDGAELVDTALALGKHGMAFLAFNTLRTDSEIYPPLLSLPLLAPRHHRDRRTATSGLFCF